MSDQKDKKLVADPEQAFVEGTKKIMDEMVKRTTGKFNKAFKEAIFTGSGKIKLDWDPAAIDSKDDTKWNIYTVPKDALFKPYTATGGQIQMSTDYDGWTPWTGVYGDYPHIPTPISEPPKPKCECGMTVTMGKEDQPSYHSDYCPIKKEIKK